MNNDVVFFATPASLPMKERRTERDSNPRQTAAHESRNSLPTELPVQVTQRLRPPCAMSISQCFIGRRLHTGTSLGFSCHHRLHRWMAAWSNKKNNLYNICVCYYSVLLLPLACLSSEDVVIRIGGSHPTLSFATALFKVELIVVALAVTVAKP